MIIVLNKGPLVRGSLGNAGDRRKDASASYSV